MKEIYFFEGKERKVNTIDAKNKKKAKNLSKNSFA